jgi:DNA-binding transcriptional ArsR family regulator
VNDSLDRRFAALADPTRRRVVELLFDGPARPGDIAARLAVSPQALSRHLRVLRRAGLVLERGLADDARVRIYGLDAPAFAGLRGWLDRAEALWADQLEAFRDYAEGHTLPERRES